MKIIRPVVTLLSLGIVVTSMLMVATVSAQAPTDSCLNPDGTINTSLCPPASDVCGKANSFLGIPTWYKYLAFNGDCDVVVSTDVTGLYDVNVAWLIGGAVFEALLRIAGLVSVAFVIVGGFKYVTSDGAPDKATEARKTIINALIGGGISIAAATIVGVLLGRLGSDVVVAINHYLTGFLA